MNLSDKFDERHFDKHFKNLEVFRKTDSWIIRLLNWILAISTGILVLMIYSVERFSIDGSIVMKPLFLIALVFIGYTIVTLGLYRLLYFFKAIGTEGSKASIRKRMSRIIKGIGDPDENFDVIGNRIDDYAKAYNVTSNYSCILKSGTTSFIVGFIICLIYIILFFTTY